MGFSEWHQNKVPFIFGTDYTSVTQVASISEAERDENNSAWKKLRYHCNAPALSYWTTFVKSMRIPNLPVLDINWLD